MGGTPTYNPSATDELIRRSQQLLQQQPAPTDQVVPQAPAVPLPQVINPPQPQGTPAFGDAGGNDGWMSILGRMLSNVFMGGTSARELAGPQAPLQAQGAQQLADQVIQQQQRR